MGLDKAPLLLEKGSSMKTFKGYLTEMKPHHSQHSYDTNELIFEQMDLLPLILSTPALERAFGGLTRIKAWHLTDIDGLEGVVELQGKKASISAITEVGHRAVFNGVLTDGEVIVELEGTQLISADVDIQTIRLDAGRRAMSIDEVMYPILYKDMKSMQKQMFKKYHNIMIKLPDYEKLDYAVWSPDKKLPKIEKLQQMAWKELGNELPQRDKGRLIKEWIDNCEKIIKKNKKAQQELRKKGRSALWDAAYDEKVINQISIKNVYVSKEWADYVGEAKPEGAPMDSHQHSLTPPDNYMPVSLYTKKMESKLKSLWKNFKIISAPKMRILINKNSLGLI
jgi:hypothetical protein